MRRRQHVVFRFALVVAVVLFLKTVLQLHTIGIEKISFTPTKSADVQERLPSKDTPKDNGSENKACDCKCGNTCNGTTVKEVRIDSKPVEIQKEVEKIKSTSRCPNLSRPRDVIYAPTGKYWQMNKRALAEIHVISAFFDDRPPVGIIPFIRILTVSTLPKNSTLFCHIWYAEISVPFVTRVIIHSAGRGERVYGIRYGQWLYSCKLPSSLPVPSHVSVSYSECESSPIYLPISVPVRSPWQHEFGICVAIAFGKIDLTLVVEWIEFNKILGVTEINIYNASMSEEMNKVFDYYKNEGLLRVHQMPPPQHDYGKKGSKISSPASLNDCMLRNAYRYRYMVVIDFDEVIVPKTQSNYSDMLKAIDKEIKLSQPWMSYSFRNEYYFLNYEVDESQPSYLRTMRYREHAKASKYLYAPKSFIDPLQCLSVFNHYCWIRFPGSPKKFTVDVSTEIATSHHYRTCGFGKAKCQEFANEKSKDNTILKYEPRLRISVSNALQNLGLLKHELSAKDGSREKSNNRTKRDTGQENIPSEVGAPLRRLNETSKHKQSKLETAKPGVSLKNNTKSKAETQAK